jgi:hypothetical protein
MLRASVPWTCSAIGYISIYAAPGPRICVCSALTLATTGNHSRVKYYGLVLPTGHRLSPSIPQWLVLWISVAPGQAVVFGLVLPLGHLCPQQWPGQPAGGRVSRQAGDSRPRVLLPAAAVSLVPASRHSSLCLSACIVPVVCRCDLRLGLQD